MNLKARDVLDMAEKILEALDSLKDILIFPEDIVLNEKVIFTDDFTGDVRVCVIPCKEEITEKENVACMLDRLATITDNNGAEYLEILRKDYLEKNYSHFGLLALLEDMKREAGS